MGVRGLNYRGVDRKELPLITGDFVKAAMMDVGALFVEMMPLHDVRSWGRFHREPPTGDRGGRPRELHRRRVKPVAPMPIALPCFWDLPVPNGSGELATGIPSARRRADFLRSTGPNRTERRTWLRSVRRPVREALWGG